MAVNDPLPCSMLGQCWTPDTNRDAIRDWRRVVGSDPPVEGAQLMTRTKVLVSASALALGAALSIQSMPARAGNVCEVWNGTTTVIPGSAPGAHALACDGIATGDYSLAIGYSSWAQDDKATAIGAYSSAVTPQSSAFGYTALAIGSKATATGAFSYAFGDYSSAYGNLAQAMGLYSSVFGTSSHAAGDTAAHLARIRAPAATTASRWEQRQPPISILARRSGQLRGAW